jgi:hypothetical protein
MENRKGNNMNKVKTIDINEQINYLLDSLSEIRFYIRRFLDTDNMQTLKRAREEIDSLKNKISIFKSYHKGDRIFQNDLNIIMADIIDSCKKTENVIIDIEEFVKNKENNKIA